MSKITLGLIISNLIFIGLSIALLFGKGIQINPIYQQHTHNHQEQFQGQLMMNLYLSKGNHIEWQDKEFETYAELKDYKTSLPPQVSYFCSIIPNSKKWIISCPNFLEEKVVK